MAYATQQDLLDAWGEDVIYNVADRDGDDNLDAAVIDAALDRATAKVNAYLSVRVKIPVTDTNALALLVDPTINIAVHMMATTRDVLTDDMKERYKDAIAFLKDLSAGRASLGIEKTSPTTPGPVATTGPDRLMGRDRLKDL